MKKAYIDFGTFNSAVCVKDSLGRVHFIAPQKSASCFAKVIPTFIEFGSQGEVVSYGQRAKNNLGFYPGRVIWGIKRLLGKTWELAKKEGELGRFSYKLSQEDGGRIAVSCGAKEYSVKDIVTEFLRCIYRDLNAPSEDLPYDPSGEKVEEAVISHPAYFDSFGLQELKEAALVAGFKNIEFVSEPEAAALSYKKDVDFSARPLVMVIDWGAGTLDIALTRFFPDEENNPHVASAYPPYGDNGFGGIDIDDLIFEEAKAIYGLEDLEVKEEALWRERLEEAKIVLSREDFVSRSCAHKGELVLFTMIKESSTLEKTPELKERKVIILEDVLKNRKKNWSGKQESILERFRSHVVYALERARLCPEDISYLIPVGGPMFMPAVRKVLAELFSGNKKVASQLKGIEEKGFKVNPLEAVAQGAANKDERDIPFRKISRAYGYCVPFIDESQPHGQILIKEGSNTGISVRIPSAIVYPDIVEPVQVALVYREETKDGVSLYRSGYYSYRPLRGPGKTGVDVEACVAQDGIISLNLYDVNSKEKFPQATFHFSRKEEKIERILSHDEAKRSAFEELERIKQESVKEIIGSKPDISEKEAERLAIDILREQLKEDAASRVSFGDFEKACEETELFVRYYKGEGFKKRETCVAFGKLKDASFAVKTLSDQEGLERNYHLFTNLCNRLEEFRNCLEQLEGAEL